MECLVQILWRSQKRKKSLTKREFMLNSLIFDFTIFSDLKLFCLEERFKQMLQYALDLIALLLRERKKHVDIKAI